MTSTAEIVKRLRATGGGGQGGPLKAEAADHIETLEAARRGEAAIAEEALKARDRAQEQLVQAELRREMHLEEVRFLAKWIRDWVSKMHRDISDEERGRIADDMCCDWVNSGIGAAITQTLAQIDTESEGESRK